MKLRNLMYAAMIACAFASCSKDEVVDGENPNAKGDGTLVVSVDTKATKAVVATPGQPETTINDIKIFVCDNNGAILDSRYLSTADLTGKNVAQAEFTGLETGKIVHCIGFANLGDVAAPASGTSFADITLVAPANVDSATELPMHGISTSAALIAGSNIRTITLVRDLARVELTGITLNTAYEQDNTLGEFVNATTGSVEFTYGATYVNSAPSTVSFTATTLPGYTKSYTTSLVSMIGGLTGWKWGTLENTTNDNVYESTGVLFKASAKQTFGENASGAQTLTKTTGESIVFYVLPNAKVNDAKPTALTLKGDLKLSGITRNNGTVVADKTVTGYYNVEIGKTGTVSGTGYNSGDGIVANKSFEISIVVIGLGSDLAGDKPQLLVKTEVKDWDTVSQVAPVK